MKNISALFIRHLDDLHKEISSYKNEKDIWKLTGDISNTPGNLCLHICGNLNFFIGNLIGNNGYVRYRDREFSDKNVSRARLLNLINETKNSVADILDKLNDEDFHKIYPDDRFGEKSTFAYIL
ncbi:MAG: hypothetical protein HGGPFJEG_01427 [Ignavibacteria bacterium]|nr:hypothetical protein [Ignavibacteria bacterium]